MRDLTKYPLTTEEGREALKKMAEELLKPPRPGDMRPFILLLAAEQFTAPGECKLIPEHETVESYIAFLQQVSYDKDTEIKKLRDAIQECNEDGGCRANVYKDKHGRTQISDNDGPIGAQG